ncbi:sensor histidine kinase [Azospirillum rugosum]|uniref:histidine kinase n=1 Tax=Azospirillum rugosum TaxID=416170 RepID=A0ABS4SKR7_9PROT|nr:sensor histidine kinase [Azospirillum rugosum]MBP2293159.1 Na+/proline symporter/nitrogen-specific signal transduction histidine kinase [Azospirillum rugosum]MDQ0526708.1 Na+/proline symporter/nitrogen-specific signal transduction histidine kinase [Azospirillum rugosum]
MPGPAIVAASFAYLFLLFAVAWWADRRADGGRSVIASPYVYALSLGVYCTTWTFYGSVGRAASLGIGFLPIYLGPTLLMLLGPLVLRKILRIAKAQRITSIADFLASRYGRSQGLGGLVALTAVIGVTPYIALQLKAVAVSFDVLSGADPSGLTGGLSLPVVFDNAFYVAILMAAFAIVFGTRHIDAAEHHEGMVAAIALESVVKLVAFLALGGVVVWGLYDGSADLFARAAEDPDIRRLFTAAPALADGSWATTMLLAAAALLCLPRQFQVMVIENVDERHLTRALWLLPLYLLLINLFVLPVAAAGLMRLPEGSVDPDMFVVALPLAEGQGWLALLAFIGGLSAATGMIIVEAIALSTMVSNDLVMPLLLRARSARLDRLHDLSPLLLAIRRAAIVAILMLGYAYFRFAGSAYALSAIGLVSFTAVAQFAPALLGGIYWTGATRRGALAGLTAGILTWAYTLLLPSFARSGWLPGSFIEAGPWGVGLLRPYALFGMDGLDPLTHALFWSLLLNVGAFAVVSLLDRPGLGERAQATAFVEVFRHSDGSLGANSLTGVPVDDMQWRGTATVGDLKRIVARFLGPHRAETAFAGIDPRRRAGAELVRRAERLLAGAIGGASARVALASAVEGGEVSYPELMRMLDETSHVIEYSRQLEHKTAELERASAALRAANLRLTELDRLKDEFLSTVTHELRTPLTSIRALTEILFDHPDIEMEQRQEFLGTVITESERLTRLINQVLDMAKIEAGEIDWQVAPMDLGAAVEQAAAATGRLFLDRGIRLEVALPPDLPPVRGDHDRLVQVVVNLLSNAAKFTPPGGRVTVSAAVAGHEVTVSVRDSGPGIAPEHQAIIFERFRQVGDTMTDKPQGTGLGLAICKRIVEHLGGHIRVDSAPGQGATFSFTVPLAAEALNAG